jgi:C1A family cysteine protease
MAKHSRGRREPKNILHLIQLSHMRHGAMLQALKAPPASWDSVKQGWVGPIKDQGQCGSCWDFSGTGMCEVAYNKAGVGGGKDKFILSEEYTLDCCQNGGCNGDDNTTVLAWAKASGLPLTADYGPYTAGTGAPSACHYKSNMTLYKISDWGFANSGGNKGLTPTPDIKKAIMNYGCVGAAVAADDAFEDWGDPQNSPSFSKPFEGSGSKSIDHDIILVGWQDDSSKAGGYWILRNTWGTTWGVDGYMAIAYGANLVGTESVFALLSPPATA